ncbi:site-2 protease family protein [Oxyplasma meridianum]|uniref:Site-2 protease family protein n=1 Tax=Oxyplasma meridianum TaxID=3073602 RepID=A0AAX4NFF7_9ARCH
MDSTQENIRVQSDDLSYVVGFVKSKVNTYDIQAGPMDIKFYYFESDNPNIEKAFDEIRTELVDRGYIPFLSHDGENFIGVTRKPNVKYRGTIVNIVMLALTLASTIYVGSVYSAAFVAPSPNAEYIRLLYGLVFFSLPLMGILGIHELGHFIVAKRHHVKASLPFFIPFPVGLGTFGAFISLRDPIPNRRAMTEIGAAGPIFGFLTALPLIFVAHYVGTLFHPVANAVIPFQIRYPLVYNLFGLVPTSSHPIFPMVFAVWVGMFATAMNLLPVGQLDGGHVLRGVMGRSAIYVDYAFLAFLFGLGFLYTGWWLLAIFVLIIGISHPPALDDYSKLRQRDILIGVFALAMFILTFTPIPLLAS